MFQVPPQPFQALARKTDSSSPSLFSPNLVLTRLSLLVSPRYEYSLTFLLLWHLFCILSEDKEGCLSPESNRYICSFHVITVRVQLV